MKDAQNFAPDATNWHRAWKWLLAGAIVLNIAAALMLRKDYLAFSHARELHQAWQAKARQEAAARAAAHAESNSPAAAERSRALRQAQALLNKSWISLFKILEQASHDVAGEVSLVSLVPGSDESGDLVVAVAGTASGHETLLRYARAVRDNSEVLDAKFVTHEPAQEGDRQIVRFRLQFTWRAQSHELAPKPVSALTTAARASS